MSRQSTDVLVLRILDLVAVCRTKPMRRKELADRWGITTRAVSHVLERANDLFGVLVAHRDGVGYTVLDTGIIDLRRLRQRGVA